jgi:hypothetical protein
MTSKSKPAEERKKRLAKALKANIAKRKAKAKAGLAQEKPQKV